MYAIIEYNTTHIPAMRKYFYRALSVFPKQSWRDRAFAFAVQTADLGMALQILPGVSNPCKSESFKTVAQMCLTLDRIKNGQTQEFSNTPLKKLWADHHPHAAVGRLLKNNTVEHYHTQMFAVLDMFIQHNIVDQSCLLDFPFIEKKSNLPLAYHTFNTAFQHQVDAARALENEGLSVVAHYIFKHIALEEETIWGLMNVMAENLALRNGRSARLISPKRIHILPECDLQYIWKNFYTRVNWTRCPFDVSSQLIVDLPSNWLEQLLAVHPTLPRHKEFYNILKYRSETSLELFEQIEQCHGHLKPSTFSNKSADGIYWPPKSQEFEKDYERYTEYTNNKAQNQRLNEAVSVAKSGVRTRKL